MSALIGGLAGYLLALVFRPGLLPPMLRIGSLHEPTTILFLGTDVVYSDGRIKKADPAAFSGRSDTLMVARLDPYRNALAILSIPRDTEALIPDHGIQKINAANAIGGPNLAVRTVSEFLQIPIDHYVVLNVHGLVDLVNELGGITVDIPKRMKYMDWTAKLKIDLTPGFHTLTGNQAMGFVRYRHDALGDIGRVERQQIFITAVLDKAMKPESWVHVPRLIEIAQNHILTDMNMSDLMGMVVFVRAIPKSNQFLTMMPGNFAGNGDWLASRSDVRRMVARMMGASFVPPMRNEVKITIENGSSYPGLGSELSRYLRHKGYYIVAVRPAEEGAARKRTLIIAQCANSEDAEMVKSDLSEEGDIVTASIGDITSAVTIRVGDDLKHLLGSDERARSVN